MTWALGRIEGASCQMSGVSTLLKYDGGCLPREFARINIAVLVVEAILFMPRPVNRIKRGFQMGLKAFERDCKRPVTLDGAGRDIRTELKVLVTYEDNKVPRKYYCWLPKEVPEITILGNRYIWFAKTHP